MATNVQALINAAISGTGARRGYAGTVQLRGETIQITDTITIDSCAGLILQGEGKRWTTLEWLGPADRPMFTVNRTSQVTLRDFRILATNPLLVAIRTQRGVGISDSTHLAYPASAFTLFNVEIDGNDVMDGGFQAYLYDVADDVKNDDSLLLDCTITGYKDYAVSYEGEQNINNQIIGCAIVGSTTAGLSTQCGVTNARRADHVATFNIYGCQVQRNKWADFDLMAQTRSILISGCHGEHSARQVKMVNGTNSGTNVNVCALTVEGCRWSTTSSEIAAGSEIVAVDTCGPVNLIGNRYGALGAAVDMKFRVTPPVGSAGFNFIGNGVRTSLATGHFPGTTPQSVSGSVLYQTSTPTVPFPT